MTDITYQRFVKRWEEVTDLPPQSIGVLTPFYKWITRRIKVMPWIWLITASVAVALILFLIFGSTITTLVTLLQRGF